MEKEEEEGEEEEEGFAAGISCGRAVEIEVIFAASHRLRLAFPASDEQVRRANLKFGITSGPGNVRHPCEKELLSLDHIRVGTKNTFLQPIKTWNNSSSP